MLVSRECARVRACVLGERSVEVSCTSSFAPPFVCRMGLRRPWAMLLVAVFLLASAPFACPFDTINDVEHGDDYELGMAETMAAAFAATAASADEPVESESPVLVASGEVEILSGASDLPPAIPDEGSPDEIVYDPMLTGLSPATKEAAGVVMPRVFFTYPDEGATLGSSDATIGVDLDPPDADLTALDLVMCIELLFRHGRQRTCFESVLDLTLSGLEEGKILAIATLEVNSSSSSSGEQESVGRTVVSKATRNIHVVLDTPPSKIGITFPRAEEHLSVQYIGVALRLDNFAADDGYFCMTISKGVELSPTGAISSMTSSEDQCIQATRSEVVVSTDFPEGLNVVRAQLYDPSGQPLGARVAHSDTWFRITPAASLPRPAMGLVREWSSCAATDLRGDMATLPVVHIAVLSALSYNRYHEAMVMIKSILFNRKRANLLHFHLVVDPAGRIFFTERLLALNLPGLRVSFHDFEAVCVGPNERLLKKFNFTQSAHYSGHAGYCRLYLYRHLKVAVPGITGVVAVESDQIFMDDIVDLWDQFAQFGDEAMVGMPEIYKPWGAGRTQPTKVDLTTDGSTIRARQGSGKLGSSNSIAGPGARHIDEYHGNGFIGGIIMLNFTRMGWGDGWHALIERSLGQFLETRNEDEKETESWNPQMNDQDIFNSIFSLHPRYVFPLPCQWNLQFHAFQEQVRMCGADTSKLDCPTAKAEGMFLCRRRPAVVHFMAQSYRVLDHGMGSVATDYYSNFWRAMDDLNPDLLRYDFLEASCVGPGDVEKEEELQDGTEESRR